MLGRVLGQNAAGIAIIGGMFVGTWVIGFWFGTMTVPGPPRPPVPSEQIRAEAIHTCFKDSANRLNRNQPDPEVLASLNEQCRRIYDGR
jgi:hypothetical protein